MWSGACWACSGWLTTSASLMFDNWHGVVSLDPYCWNLWAGESRVKEADRKLASALVVAVWASVTCAIAAAIFGVSDSKSAGAAVAARALMAAEMSPNMIKEAALAVERETRCLTDAIYHEARS